MTLRNTPRISFIGFGEAGQAIAAGLILGQHVPGAVDPVELLVEQIGDRFRIAARKRGDEACIGLPRSIVHCFKIPVCPAPAGYRGCGTT